MKEVTQGVHMKKISLISVLLLVAAFAAAQGPDNAPPPPDQPQAGQGQWGHGRRGGPGVGGTITAIAGNAITIKTMDGNTAQVNVTDSTRFRKDRQDAKLADFKVGDNIMVRGQKSGEGIWTAEMVAVPPPGMGGENFREGMGKKFIMGEIKSINGTQLEIARPDGVTQTIAVDENTSFRKEKESVTLADLKPGDHVFGRGEVKNNVFVAAELNSGQPRFGRRGDGQTSPPPPQ
jgi:hypothetical protein